jgi:hypothetical protein
VKANTRVRFIVGVVLALALVGACGKPQAPIAKAKFQLIRVVESDNWNSLTQVVKDPLSERCYLRSRVRGGWNYMLLQECK